MERVLGCESNKNSICTMGNAEKAASAQGHSLANSKGNSPGDVEFCVEFALPRGGRKC